MLASVVGMHWLGHEETELLVQRLEEPLVCELVDEVVRNHSQVLDLNMSLRPFVKLVKHELPTTVITSCKVLQAVFELDSASKMSVGLTKALSEVAVQENATCVKRACAVLVQAHYRVDEDIPLPISKLLAKVNSTKGRTKETMTCLMVMHALLKLAPAMFHEYEDLGVFVKVWLFLVCYDFVSLVLFLSYVLYHLYCFLVMIFASLVLFSSS